MSLSLTATGELRGLDTETITGPMDVQSVLDVLTDSRCRAMIEATTTDALTAKELSRAVELPLSTTYRKLDDLTDVALLEERTRICRHGSHSSEYRRVVDDVVVSMGPDTGATLTVTRERIDDHAMPLAD